MVNMTNDLNIGTDADHLAFVPFSSPADTRVVFQLNFSVDKNVLIEMLRNQTYNGGTTSTVKYVCI